MQSLLFFVGPLLAALFGMYTMYATEMPLEPFYANLLGIVIGVPLVLWLAPLWGDRSPKMVLQLSSLSLLLLLSCFLFAGPNDVHRWIIIGSYNINVSMIVLPVILYCLHQLLHHHQYWHSVVLFAATGMILGFEPDAGQATAFSLAGLAIFFRNKMDYKLRLAAAVMAIIAIFLAWNRVDLLEPVEYVEEIFYMYASLGPIGFIAMVFISLSLFVPFVYLSFKRIETVRTLSVAFIVYLASAFIITEFGHYPVPVMGAGAASVIGWFLMLSFVSREG